MGNPYRDPPPLPVRSVKGYRAIRYLKATTQRRYYRWFTVWLDGKRQVAVKYCTLCAAWKALSFTATSLYLFLSVLSLGKTLSDATYKLGLPERIALTYQTAWKHD